MKTRLASKIVYLYIALWFLLNLLFLDRFPFMHSDESWLSGLTREMMAAGFHATEPFFDLLPRYPHAIKLLFHLLQMPFLAVFGYSLFSVRLLSLLFGAAALAAFYGLARLLTKKRGLSLAFTIILSLDVQFLYASHTARQDIIIAFGILAAVYCVLKNLDAWGFKKDVTTGALVGLFIGIHPNSLMVAFAAGAVYLYGILQKKQRLVNLLLLILTVACFAAAFVFLSLLFDPQFFTHYAQYGGELGATQTLAEKLRAFPEYFLKLYLKVSGTYYTPFIKPQLVLFGLCALFLAVSAFKKRESLQTLLPFVAVLAAIALIGRYSQPAVIVLFPLGYLMALTRVELPPKRVGALGVALLGILVALSSFFAVRPYCNDDYKSYLAGLRESVPADARTLANLNGEFAFERGALLDYRNLSYLEDRGLTFAQYIEGNEIDYIVYPAEMDFIYAKRPVYNILYGNLYPYYGEMQRFLNERCTLVTSFASPYAMRIPRFMYEGEWEVRVYRVESEGNS